MLHSVGKPAKLRGLSEQIFGGDDLELHLRDGEQVLDVAHLVYLLFDLAIDHILDGDGVDGARIGHHEFVDELRGVGEGRMHHRQLDLRRGEDDEAAIDTIGVEILRVVQLLGNLWREAGAVDLEGGELRLRHAEGIQRLVVTRDQMRLLDFQKAAEDESVFTKEVHQLPLAFISSISRSARSRRRWSRTMVETAASSERSE